MSGVTALASQIPDQGPSVFYEEGFRNVLEDHLYILINSKGTIAQNVDPAISYKYENDLFGVLLELSVPVYLHWITMRMNGYTSPLEYTKDKNILLIPNTSDINRLRSMYKTTHSIK